MRRQLFADIVATRKPDGWQILQGCTPRQPHYKIGGLGLQSICDQVT